MRPLAAALVALALLPAAAGVAVFSLGGPVSSFPVSLQLSQRIEATDPLRAGTYSMPLTLSLSTTSPCRNRRLRARLTTARSMLYTPHMASSPIAPPESKLLSRSVADWLAARIIGGELAPGERLH